MIFFLKILCVVGVVVIASLIGFGESYRLKLRVKNLESVILFLQHLEEEVQYTSRPITEIIDFYSETIPLCGRCRVFLQNGESFPESWKKALQHNANGLIKEDRQYLEEFGNSFGRMDRKGQLQECRLTKTRLETKLTEARGTEEKKAKLYRSLGILCGFAVLLVAV